MPKRKSYLSPQQMATLVELARLKAGNSFVDVSSSRLGSALDVTQQGASKRLLDLEQAGLIERMHSGRSLKVRLTDTGLRAVVSFYSELKGALEEEEKDLDLSGRVFTGLGEGGYYVSMKGYSKHFEQYLGFEPFPGTLNIRLSAPAMIAQRARLGYLKGLEVPGFKDGKRSYGPVKCFKAEIGGKVNGAVLAIERTHYDSSVLEVIAPLNLRRALRLKDGDECPVKVHLD